MKQRLDIDHLSVSYLYLAIFTTITVLAWVGFEVFRSLTTPVETLEVTAAEQRPIEETLDQEALALIRDRLHLDTGTLEALEVTAIVLSPTPVPEATGSATIDTSGGSAEEATTSGSI